MVINIPVKKEMYYLTYIKLWNGIIGMTDKELEIVAKLVEKYIEISSKVSDNKLVSEILFSPNNLKEIRLSLGMKENLFNNYKASLKEKHVLIKTENLYYIDPRLIPKESITFKFIVS